MARLPLHRCAIIRPMNAFRIMGRVFKALYEELFPMLGFSALWWASLLLVLPAGAATGGLQAVANRMANYKRIDSSYFWGAVRSSWLRSTITFWLLLLVPIMMWASILFYLWGEGWMPMLGVALGWVLLLTLMVGQYVFPFLWQQDEPNLRMALKNGLVLAIRSPLYSILMVAFQTLLIIVSTLLVITILVLPALIALSGNFALTGLLQEMELAPQPPEISGT